MNELDLAQLLKGHEGESIFLTTMGEVLVEKVSEEHLFFRLRATEPGWRLNATGKMNENGEVIAYPSRALYEQYPLDPYTAWMVWQEEQKKYPLRFACHRIGEEALTEFGDVYFRNRVDREQAIEVIDAFLKQVQQSKCVASLCEEIKAIIEKYSK